MQKTNCPTCGRLVNNIFDHVDQDCETWDEKELSDVAYLRDLVNRLRDIPVMYGVDGYDIDRLSEIANNIEIKQMLE